MTHVSGFKLLGSLNAKILILGSMPSVKSIEKQQYYGHPQNAFWRIMAALFNEEKPLDYLQGQRLMQAESIAVWDVLKSGIRQGSLDSAIDKKVLETNDFIALFKSCKQLKHVFFNGGTAEALYKKHVFQYLPNEYKTLNYFKLPSTSPAYAAMRYADKLAAWSVIKGIDQY